MLRLTDPLIREHGLTTSCVFFTNDQRGESCIGSFCGYAAFPSVFGKEADGSPGGSDETARLTFIVTRGERLAF